jgi:hypothetical protein
MTIFFFVCTVVCVLGAIQERKDFLRCLGFLLFALLMLLLGLGTRFMN